MVSAYCIAFLVFVHWKKGSPCWVKISPFFFYTILMMNYLLIPMGNVVLSIYLMCDPSLDLELQTSESFVVFFFVVCLMRLVEYFTLIRRSVLLDAKIYQE